MADVATRFASPALETAPRRPVVTLELEQPNRLLKKQRPGRWRTVLLRAVLPLLLLAIWAIGTGTGAITPQVLSSPWHVVMTYGNLFRTEDLMVQIGVSLERAVIGLAIGASIGLLLGIGAGLSQLWEEAVDSSMQMLRTLPFLALVPLFIIWFGIGELPKIIIIALATICPVYLNAYSGVRNVDRRVVEASRAFGLKGARLAKEVVLPQALPQILTGIRFASGVSVLALIAAEQINAHQGIGYLLYQAQSTQQVDVLLVCVTLYCILGLGADLIVRLVEHVAVPWRAGVATR
jgi:sulfonate transport system permease protein